MPCVTNDSPGASIMARIAVLSPSEAGHLFPLAAVATELVRRRHEVAVIAQFQGRPPARAMGPALPQAGNGADSLAVGFPPLGGAQHIRRRLVRRLSELLRPGSAEAVLQRVPAMLKELAADGVVVDQVLAGGGPRPNGRACPS